MFLHYTLIEEVAREHINDLIQDAENEHQRHEYLKTHPEYKTASRIRAWIDKVFHRSQKSDFTRHPNRAL